MAATRTPSRLESGLTAAGWAPAEDPELAIEAYYTFGPALAGLIDESEDLRGIARGVLDPVVDVVREQSYPGE